MENRRGFTGGSERARSIGAEESGAQEDDAV